MTAENDTEESKSDNIPKYIFIFCSLILLALSILVIYDVQFQKTSSKEIQTDTCVRKHTEADSFVCVCNATYCDTMEKPSKTMAPGKVLVYTTSRDEHRFYKEVLNVETIESIRTNHINENRSEECPPKTLVHGEVEICIDTTKLKQQIFGFGGSFTDSAGINIKRLSPNAQKKLMESYFSENGLEYNLGRVPIGGSDFSTWAYSYDDESIEDMELNNFTLKMEDFDYKIHFIKQAQEISPHEIKLVATVWSPPAWMKINNKLNGFGWLKMPVGGPYYQTYAKYHIKFLDEYKKNGIQFWGLTPTNEPIAGFVPGYAFNCVGFTPSWLRTFVNQNLGPLLKSSSHNATKMLIYDLGRIGIEYYVNEIMSDVMANTYVDGIALHWYHDPIVGPAVLDKLHKTYPSKYLFMTEASIINVFSTGKLVVLGSWQRGDIYAYYIIQNMQHWVTGWIDWNLALDIEGGPNWAKNFVDSPIIVSNTSDEFYKQPMYYTIGHFSKFIPEGSRVIDLPEGTVQSSLLTKIAFLRPDSGIVLVVLNSKNQPVVLKITDPKFGTFSANITGNAIQTYIWWRE